MKSKQNNKQPDRAEGKDVQFSDLFVLEDIQRLQDIFSESCGVASIITFPDGTPITKPSNFCNLCSNIIRKTDKGISNCLKSDSVLGRKSPSGPVVRKCLSGGLWDAGASITVANIHIANWLIGQVRNEEIDEPGMVAYAEEIGVNRDVFMAALQEVPVMSLEQFKKVSNMLFAFASEISEKAYKNLELKRQIAERDKAEQELKRNEVRLGSLIKLLQNPIESTQQFLDNALTEAINLTESKIGYIYFYNEEKKQFILNSWSKDVMKECSVAEPQTCYELEKTGILGEAVRQRKPILLNNFKAPDKLKKGYPKGHVELLRFLTVPIFNDDQIVAVVAVANKESDYNQSDILQLSILLDNVWKVSGRKNAEKALIENEKRFRNLFENAQEGIFQTTIDGAYISVNPALAKMYGFATPEELMNSRKNLSKDAYYNPEERSNFLKMMDEQGFVKGYEYEVKDKHGNKIWFYEDAKAILDEKGKLLYFEGFVVDITERKKAELELIESEERYKRIASGLTDYLYTVKVKDGKAVETHHSEACLNVTGYSSKEFISDPYLWINMVVPEERAIVAGRFLLILEGKDLPAFEHRIVRKDGEVRWISDTAVPKFDPDGSLTSYDGIIKDITERKQAEELLRNEEEKYRLLIQNSHDIIYTLSSEGIFTFVSPSWTSLLGHPNNEIVGKGFDEFVSPDDLEECRTWLKKVIESGQRQEGIEYRVRHKNGKWFWHTSSAVPLRDNSGKVVGFYGTARDITNQKSAEQELAYTKALLNTAFEQSPIPMVLASAPDKTIRMINSAAADFLGVNILDYRNKVLGEITIPWKDYTSDGKPIKSAYLPLSQALKGVATKNMEILVERPDGTKRWELNNGSPIYDQKGKLIAGMIIFQDITERKENQEKLMKSEMMLRTVLDNFPGIVFWKDTQSIYLGCNQSFASGAGLKNPSEVIQKTDFDFPWKNTEAEDYRNDDYEVMFNGKEKVHIIEMQHQVDGNIMWLDTSKYPLRDSQGKVIGIFGVSNDITELKQSEEVLRQISTRLALATRAGGVGVWDYDLLSGSLLWDDQMMALYGIEKENFTGAYEAWKNGLHPEDMIQGDEEIKMAISGEKEFDTEFRVVWPDGSIHTIRALANVQRDNSGKAIRMIGTNWDITDRKHIEEALKESEEKFRYLVAEMQVGILLQGPKSEILLSNPKALELLGLSENQLLGKTSFDPDWNVTHEDGSLFPGHKHPVVLAIESCKPVRNTVMGVYRPSLSDRVWLLVDAVPELNENGTVKQVVVSFIDITERKQAEEALIKSEERYRSFISQVSEGVYRFECDKPMPLTLSLEDQIDFIYDHMFIAECNQAILKMYGASDEKEIIGKGQLDFHGGRYNEVNRELLRKFILNGYTLESGITEEKNAAGKEIFISNNSLGIIENDHLIRMWGTQVDITETKISEEKLRESEEKLSTLFSSMTEMVALHEVVFDDHGKAINYRITDCNDSYTAVTAIKKEDAVGKLANEVYQTEEPPYLHEFTQVGITGKTYEYNTYFAPMDKHFMISVVSPKKNHFATITTDITAIRQIQDVITTKNKELENYLYVASHDLRSPLVNIQGFSQRLQKQADSINTFIADHKLEPETQLVLNKITKEDIPKTLQFIFSNVTKMDTLINGLLQISRTGRIKMTISKINMNNLFKTIIAGLNFQIAETSSEIILEKLADCYGDENQLNQLFSNIIGNAIKYRDLNRKLIIKIDCSVQFNKVIYTIRDTGIGIGHRHLERIWDIFYRVDSASSEAGDGIGLSLAKRITEKHKGKIWAESEEGKGSTFSIELQKNAFEE